jgi:predicted esterase YcpF (UPF0227 family)
MSNDGSLRTRLIYLHGFNSSPDSEKAQSLIRYTQQEKVVDDSGNYLDLLVPSLSHKPATAIKRLYGMLADEADNTLLVGSSLGGFYSIYLAQKFSCKVVLINPLVSLPAEFADSFPGTYTNPFTGEIFNIDSEDVAFLQKLEIKKIRQQENYLLLLEKADEVIDYRIAVKKLPAARQLIVDGGSHQFESFNHLLSDIMQFAGLRSSV